MHKPKNHMEYIADDLRRIAKKLEDGSYRKDWSDEEFSGKATINIAIGGGATVVTTDCKCKQ